MVEYIFEIVLLADELLVILLCYHDYSVIDVDVAFKPDVFGKLLDLIFIIKSLQLFYEEVSVKLFLADGSPKTKPHVVLFTLVG
jgi:hypothetical protein